MKKILITDDRDEIIMLLKATLRDSEYRILNAHNGQEAVDIAQKELPDLIIMDVMMPVMDGYTACEIIKNSDETKDIPVILLTAKGQVYDKERGFAAGAEDYIVKPFSPVKLIEKVEKILSRRKEVVK